MQLDGCNLNTCLGNLMTIYYAGGYAYLLKDYQGRGNAIIFQNDILLLIIV